MTILGGLISGFIFITLYSKLLKLDIKGILNTFSISSAIGIAITRMGCYFHGCCFGKKCDISFIGIKWSDYYKYSHVFIHHSYIKTPFDSLIYPTQVFEAIFCLLIFIAMVISRKIGKQNQFYMFAVSYLVLRFFVEFLRDDGIKVLFNVFTVWQCVCFGVLGVWVVGRSFVRSVRKN